MPSFPQSPSLTDPGSATILVPVTTSDTVDLPNGSTRYLFVTTATTAKLTDSRGNIVTSFPLQVGVNFVCVSRVWTTGTTTTTGIFAGY